MRRGTTSEWNSADPILNEGEIGYNSTLASFKIGDGETVWSELDYYQAAADITPIEIGAIAATEKGAADGVAELDGNKNVITALSVVFEGATANDFETLLTVTEPASDITISLPNATDTLVGRATTDTLTNKSISGSSNTLSNIGNSALTNSAITINGTSVSLGGSVSIGDITAITTAVGSGLSGGGSSGDITLSIDTAVTADLTTAQTLTNKTLTSPKINEDVAVTATATELNYVDGVTSAIQTQIDLKAPAASPTFTGTVVLPSTVNGPNTTTSVNLLSTSTSANITLGAQQTSGNLTIGGGTQRTTGIVGIATGATTSGTKTINIGTGSTGGTTEITIGSSSGATSNITLNGTVTAANNLVVTGDLTVNGTTTTIDTAHLQVEDKNITLAYGNTSDVGADGGGITLLGTTNKTFNWVDSTDAWTSSEHMNLLTGKSYKINNTAISAALPALTWGEVKDGKSGLVIS
jgi:hypothetical protein